MTNIEVDSLPQGAEARASSGAACRTPCVLSVPASEFTVSFAMPGFQPQTVPVRLVPPESGYGVDAGAPPRLLPNPVYAELAPMPTGPAKKKPAPKKPAPARTSSNPPAATPAAMAPTPAPAGPWPAPR